MGKVIYEGWSKPGDEIPQPISVTLGGNLRANSKPPKPGSKKVQHGSSSGGKYPFLSPAEAERLGIDTSPVLTISPVPRTPTPDVGHDGTDKDLDAGDDGKR